MKRGTDSRITAVTSGQVKPFNFQRSGSDNAIDKASAIGCVVTVRATSSAPPVAHLSRMSLRAAILVVSTAMLLTVAASFALSFRSAQLASAELNDIVYRQGSAPDADRLRQLCHRIISCRFSNHHDAFALLIDCGDSSSIPYLIKALRWHQPDGGSGVCTDLHCVEALEKITGQHLRYDTEAWSRWYRLQRKKV